MNREQALALPRKLPSNPLLDTIPNYLKDPANYEKICKAILDAGATPHSHSEVIQWAGCKTCQRKEWDRKEMMKRLGFQSGKQYLLWKKIHEQIRSPKRSPIREIKNEPARPN